MKKTIRRVSILLPLVASFLSVGCDSSETGPEVFGTYELATANGESPPFDGPSGSVTVDTTFQLEGTPLACNAGASFLIRIVEVHLELKPDGRFQEERALQASCGSASVALSIPIVIDGSFTLSGDAIDLVQAVQSYEGIFSPSIPDGLSVPDRTGTVSNGRLELSGPDGTGGTISYVYVRR